MTQSIRWLQYEIADRMLQKLDIVKLQAKDILIIPDFPGVHTSFLRNRFPKASLHTAPELRMTAVEAYRYKASRMLDAVLSFFRFGSTVSLDSYRKTGKLDLPDNSIDLIFSDLFLQDLPDPRHFLKECWRVLREGGLLTFSYLGPDTGKELKSIDWPKEYFLKNLLSPWDMHDLGDALIGEGFSDPVMDMEFINLTYESDATALTDAKNLGLIQAPSNSATSSILPKLSDRLTLEVVYGHAWAIGKHLAKAQDHVAYIDLNQIQRKSGRDPA